MTSFSRVVLAAPSNVDRASLKRQPLSSPPSSNKTLNFFDEFTHHAKQRSSAARSQVLDELLLHEDDPMWFVLEGEDKNITNDDPHDATSHTPTTGSQCEVSKELDGTQRQTSSDSILLDIDHDYFRSSTIPTSHASPRSLSPMRHRMPSRSSSVPPLMVAPPIACQLSASPTTSPTTSDLEDLDPSNQAQASSLERSPSFSSKLMSSLLRGAQPSPPSTTTSRLGDVQSSSETTLDHTGKQTAALTDEDSKSSRPLVVSTSPMSLVSERRATQFSVSKQRIPFSPAVVTHSTSPFAATFYRPPTGAPGFEGDRYDWDKGFSDELESERKSLTSVDVNDESGSEGNGSVIGAVASSSVGSPGSRGWGTSFRFGFGSKRGKLMPKAASLSSMTQGNGLNGREREGKDSKAILPLGQEIEPDTADLRDHDGGFNRHERDYSSTSSIGSGMGDLIERKVGTIELAGRSVLSDSVLMPELASMVGFQLQ